jgi:hypothetical protein
MECTPLVEVVAETYHVTRVAVIAAAEARSVAIIAEKETIAAVQYVAIAATRLKESSNH